VRERERKRGGERRERGRGEKGATLYDRNTQALIMYAMSLYANNRDRIETSSRVTVSQLSACFSDATEYPIHG